MIHQIPPALPHPIRNHPSMRTAPHPAAPTGSMAWNNELLEVDLWVDWGDERTMEVPNRRSHMASYEHAAFLL